MFDAHKNPITICNSTHNRKYPTNSPHPIQYVYNEKNEKIGFFRTSCVVCNNPKIIYNMDELY